jgi:arylsulfatase A-like enzyme
MKGRAVVHLTVLITTAALLASAAHGRAIILISLDTLRQDHLGCYGYGRDTSPHIDRFASEAAVLFEAAYAQAPYTLPSHMSMLTGLYPEAHGILLPDPTKEGGRNRLAEGVKTLAEVLKEKGYKTTAFTDGLLVDGRFGFDQGFDDYRDERKTRHEENGFRRYGEALQQWIKNNAAHDFFLFIHTYDTHAPYVPPEPFRSRFLSQPAARTLPQASLLYCSLLGVHNAFRIEEYQSLQEVVDRYDGSIAFVDDQLGKLFGLLKKLGLWEKALIVVTSDHGESFMENRLMMGHGLCVGNEEILVPLLIKLPGSLHRGRRVTRVVESVDIMPTILAAMDLSVPEDVQGQDLLQGLNHDRWKKDYAYGSSPNTGGSHYLVHKNIKFIGAVEDRGGELLQRLIMPTAPPESEKPKVPYKVSEKKKYFYDFKKDPLGVSELFYRGDRAYDMIKAKHEWKAEPIRDKAILKRYKEAAQTLAAQSILLGKKYEGESGEGTPLSLRQREQLKALGYTGLLAESPKEDGPSKIGDPSPFLKDDPPLVDRSLLHQGDAILWAFNRTVKKKGQEINPEKFAPLFREARACYERFAETHPDKEHWVSWRMKYLDLAALFLKAPKSGDGR